MAVPRPEGRDGGPVGLASLGIGNPETPNGMILRCAQDDKSGTRGSMRDSEGG